MGVGYSLVVEQMLSMPKVLGLTPSISIKKKNKK